MNRYDIIGDIHGHADELHSLLAKLGYRKWKKESARLEKSGGDAFAVPSPASPGKAPYDNFPEVSTLFCGNGSVSYSHVEGRKVIFLGDFIDRGPKIRAVLETVRGMVDAGQALAILGNHEVNAMRFNTLGSDGEYLRPHTDKNTKQHQATLGQFPDPAEWSEWIEWFAGLPLSLDLGGVRAVHACWDQEAIAELATVGRLEGAALEKYSRAGTVGHETISQIINGPEALLPDGCEQETADGTSRPDIRVKWWINLTGATSREAIFPHPPAGAGRPAIPDLPPRNLPATSPYPEDAPPTFFGHYALKSPSPASILPNLACLDYGTGKGGFLCAYRWDGEREIDPAKFVVHPDR